MKKVVGIFMGGYSSEREISLQSGQLVYDNLDETEWDKYKVDISEESWTVQKGEDTWPLKRDELTFDKAGKTMRFDIVFNAIHGHPGEDGYIQAILELNKIPHSSCNAFESALTFNKSKTNALLAAQGFTVPKSILLKNGTHIDYEKIAEEIKFPLFVKPNRSGSSFGVTKVSSLSEIAPAIENALKEDNQVLVEEAIIGTEVGCGVFMKNGVAQAIAITELVSDNDFFDYDAKYKGESDEITPANIIPELYTKICTQSQDVYNYLNLWGIVRIDYIIKNKTPYLIEVNSIPGLSAASIVPQQLAYKKIALPSFFGDLLNETIAISTK